MRYKFLIVGTIFNLTKVNTVPCMCATALSSLSLSLTASKQLDGLAYIESTTDACSQHYNDIEHAENNKQCQKCILSPVSIT